jgi:hypothetical protein
MEWSGCLAARFGEKGRAEQIAIHRTELDQIIDIYFGVH